jgi:hypothetical protein
MTIGHMTLRIARWIVIGVAALGLTASIFYGKGGEIPGVLFAAIYYLLLIELLRLVYRAVRSWFGMFQGLQQKASHTLRSRTVDKRPCDTDRQMLPDDEDVRVNPTTGWFMTGPLLDAGGNAYGESEHH